MNHLFCVLSPFSSKSKIESVNERKLESIEKNQEQTFNLYFIVSECREHPLATLMFTVHDRGPFGPRSRTVNIGGREYHWRKGIPGTEDPESKTGGFIGRPLYSLFRTIVNPRSRWLVGNWPIFEILHLDKYEIFWSTIYTLPSFPQIRASTKIVSFPVIYRGN